MTTHSPDAVKERLRIAKLDESYSCGPVQAVSFSTNLNDNEYRIFEVNPELVDALLQKEKSKCVELKDEPKSSNTGHVFLCTKNKTFSILEAETSNSLLFVSNWWLPSSKLEECQTNAQSLLNTTVQLRKSSYFELHDCVAPSLRLLKQILRPSTYQGPVEDSFDMDSGDGATSVKNYTLDELRAMFPCSSVELNQALNRLRACELRGYVRLMDTEYLTQVIRDIFACADENSWNWRVTGFPTNALLEHLAETHDLNLVNQIIPMFFVKRIEDREQFLFPINSSICQVIGEHLLSVTNSFDLTDFLAVWRSAVPDGLRPKLRKHLTCAGRAFSQVYINSLQDQNSRAYDLSSTRFRSISLLCSEDLPDDTPESRLSALFERCTVWPEAELASYLTDLFPSEISERRSLLEERCTSREVDSDLEYLDPTDPGCLALAESNAMDDPKPVPPVIGSLLSKNCRITNSKWGRFYTTKHAQT